MLRDASLIPLSHQHHNGLALCVLTDRSAGEDRSDENVARLAQKIIERYEVELTNHFEIEEKILFPACSSPLIEVLLKEHREIERLIEQLRTEPSFHLLGRFTILLRRHIRREENELFEIMQKELPRETLDELGRQIEAKVVRVCL